MTSMMTARNFRLRRSEDARKNRDVLRNSRRRKLKRLQRTVDTQIQTSSTLRMTTKMKEKAAERAGSF